MQPSGCINITILPHFDAQGGSFLGRSSVVHAYLKYTENTILGINKALRSIMKRNHLFIGLFLFLWVFLLPLDAWARETKANNASAHRMKAKIDQNSLPEHIAIIMDGNRRWATKQGKPRAFGHRENLIH